MTGTIIQKQNSETDETTTVKRRFNIMDIVKFRKKRNKLTAANRQYERHTCWCIGTMSIANRSISLDGIVSEVSKRGIKFRPAKTHLLERKGVQVSIDFAGIHMVGKIAATRQDGYGVALYADITDKDIETIVEMQSTILTSMSSQSE